MGFFFQQAPGDRRQGRAPREMPVELLKQSGCKACPLNSNPNKQRNPKMEPTGGGRGHTKIYWLGEFPSEKDDKNGEPWSAESGRMLRAAMSGQTDRVSRYSNALRCRPDTMPPGKVELACCAGLTERDIEAEQPFIVVGLGEAAFTWATKQLGVATSEKMTNVTRWRGACFPIRVGSHTCWFYPMLHPTYVMTRRGKKNFDTEYDHTFRWDVRRVEQLTESLPMPVVVTTGQLDGVVSITGQEHGDLGRLETALQAIISRAGGLIGTDIETRALRPYGAPQGILTAAVSCAGMTVAFPMYHPSGWYRERDRREARQLYMEVLTNVDRVVAHNAGFEIEWLGNEYGPELTRLVAWEDSMAQAHTLDERPGTMSLGAQTFVEFGFDLKELTPVDAKRILEYPLDQVLVYNGADARWCLELFNARRDRIESDPTFRGEYERKMRLIPTLALAQMKGIPVDLGYAAEIEHKLTTDIAACQRRLERCVEIVKFEEQTGRKFSPTAPDDAAIVLRDILQLEEGAREGGKYSTDESVLSAIPKSVALSPSILLEHRGMSKLLGTYITPITSGRIVYPDGMLHTSYTIMLTVTGRLSSEDPNVQNYPKRKHREVRGVISVTRLEIDGAVYWLVSFDYGQVEARVIAMASEDINLVDAMWTDYDIHGFWYQRLAKLHPAYKDFLVTEFDVPGDDEAKLFKVGRQEAKNKWVFPQFFGSSPFSCAKNLHVPDDIAEKLAGEFWDTFSGVKRWQKRLLKTYERQLYSETLTGRKRRGPMTLNEIINNPIQGTASDIVTDAQNRLSEMALEIDQPQFIAPLNVHDDLTFLIPDETLDQDIQTIARYMCDSQFEFINVPIVVEVSVGKRWDKIEEIAKYRSDRLGFHTRTTR